MTKKSNSPAKNSIQILSLKNKVVNFIRQNAILCFILIPCFTLFVAYGYLDCLMNCLGIYQYNISFNPVLFLIYLIGIYFNMLLVIVIFIVVQYLRKSNYSKLLSWIQKHLYLTHFIYFLFSIVLVILTITSINSIIIKDLEQSIDTFCLVQPDLDDTQHCIGSSEYSHILNQEIYVHHCSDNSLCRNLKYFF